MYTFGAGALSYSVTPFIIMGRHVLLCRLVILLVDVFHSNLDGFVFVVYDTVVAVVVVCVLVHLKRGSTLKFAIVDITPH